MLASLKGIQVRRLSSFLSMILFSLAFATSAQAINWNPNLLRAGVDQVDITKNNGQGITAAIIDDGVDIRMPQINKKMWYVLGEGDGLYLSKTPATTAHYNNMHGSWVAQLIAADITNNVYRGPAPNVTLLALPARNGGELVKALRAVVHWNEMKKGSSAFIEVLNLTIDMSGGVSSTDFAAAALEVKTLLAQNVFISIPAGNKTKQKDGSFSKSSTIWNPFPNTASDPLCFMVGSNYAGDDVSPATLRDARTCGVAPSEKLPLILRNNSNLAGSTSTFQEPSQGPSSWSAPFMSALAILLKQMNRSWSQWKILQIMKDTATELPKTADEQGGPYKLINFPKAIAEAKSQLGIPVATPTPTPKPTPTPTPKPPVATATPKPTPTPTPVSVPTSGLPGGVGMDVTNRISYASIQNCYRSSGNKSVLGDVYQLSVSERSQLSLPSNVIPTNRVHALINGSLIQDYRNASTGVVTTCVAKNSTSPNAYLVKGGIRFYFIQRILKGSVGYPISAQLTDGITTMQAFERAIIYYFNSNPAVVKEVAMPTAIVNNYPAILLAKTSSTDTNFSAPFLGCYIRNGGQSNLGRVSNNGSGGVYIKSWLNGSKIQDFAVSSTNKSLCVSPKENPKQAFALRGKMYDWMIGTKQWGIGVPFSDTKFGSNFVAQKFNNNGVIKCYRYDNGQAITSTKAVSCSSVGL